MRVARRASHGKQVGQLGIVCDKIYSEQGIVCNNEENLHEKKFILKIFSDKNDKIRCKNNIFVNAKVIFKLTQK